MANREHGPPPDAVGATEERRGRPATAMAPDETPTPGWMTALGLALFVVGMLWWAVGDRGGEAPGAAGGVPSTWVAPGNEPPPPATGDTAPEEPSPQTPSGR